MQAWWRPNSGSSYIWDWHFNSLFLGRSGCDVKNESFNLVLLISIFLSSYENVLRWMPPGLTDDNSTLVPDGNKPLREPILTHIYHHMASLGHNELRVNIQSIHDDSLWQCCGSLWKQWYYKKIKEAKTFRCWVPVVSSLDNVHP